MTLPTIVLILAAVFLVSAVSFVGVLALYLQKNLNELINYLVSFAVGGLLGAAFLDLLPNSIGTNANWGFFVLAGILTFFLIELYFHWHHHHTHAKCHHKHIHPVGYLNLIGDGAHNFIDGMIVAASFMVSVPLGLVTTIAVIMHEIPQEFGDFGILIYSGFTKTKALIFNFASALTAVAGALVTYFFIGSLDNFSLYLIPFAAGGFIYIAAADLLPEIHKHQGKEVYETVAQIGLIFLGIGLIWFIGMYFKG
jgi:zinc and cadmium transporter